MQPSILNTPQVSKTTFACCSFMTACGCSFCVYPEEMLYPPSHRGREGQRLCFITFQFCSLHGCRINLLMKNLYKFVFAQIRFIWFDWFVEERVRTTAFSRQTISNGIWGTDTEHGKFSAVQGLNIYLKCLHDSGGWAVTFTGMCKQSR